MKINVSVGLINHQIQKATERPGEIFFFALNLKTGHQRPREKEKENDTKRQFLRDRGMDAMTM